MHGTSVTYCVAVDYYILLWTHHMLRITVLCALRIRHVLCIHHISTPSISRLFGGLRTLTDFSPAQPVPGSWIGGTCPLPVRGSLGWGSPSSFLACLRPLRFVRSPSRVWLSHEPGFAGAALSAGISRQVPLGNEDE